MTGTCEVEVPVIYRLRPTGGPPPHLLQQVLGGLARGHATHDHEDAVRIEHLHHRIDFAKLWVDLQTLASGLDAAIDRNPARHLLSTCARHPLDGVQLWDAQDQIEMVQRAWPVEMLDRAIQEAALVDDPRQENLFEHARANHT
jgi:hypothetical protein